jgi:hypothetical protein
MPKGCYATTTTVSMTIHVHYLAEESIAGSWIKMKDISSRLGGIFLATWIAQFKNFSDLPQYLGELL